MQEMIVIMGLLLGTATAIAMFLRLLKQSSIIAFICTGMLAGIFREKIHLPPEVLDFFIEVGIIMLLFMAGLEVDIKSFFKRWRLVVINGLGQVVFLTALGLGLGYFYIGITQTATLIFFALCLTLSSTIIVLGTLKEKRAMESLHGQIVLGLMVIQDIIAVLALSFIKNIADDAPLLEVVGLLFFKMAVLIVVLTLLSKFVLRRLFHFFARSPEMLFIGSLGYCMGIAGLSEFFHFSPEIGAFFAGASLAFLPYKLEIEDKVEPLKAFGVILFFITLGFNIQFKPEMLESLVQVAVLALFVVFGTPLIMVLLGWATRLKARPAFLIGGIINQISEFSLILATLSHRAGVFDDSVFNLIVLTCLATFVLSSLGHQYLDALYTLSRRTLRFIDRSSLPYQIKSHLDFEFENHVVILSFNEIAHDLMEFYGERGEKVLLIDIDPEINQHFEKEDDHNAVPLYADMDDPDVWKEFHFDKAKMVISCMVRGQEAEIAIARWIKERNPKVLFVATTDSQEEALELYESGVDYVIQTEFLAAEITREIFTRELAKGGDAFKELAQSHQKKIREQQQKIEPIFRLL